MTEKTEMMEQRQGNAALGFIPSKALDLDPALTEFITLNSSPASLSPSEEKYVRFLALKLRTVVSDGWADSEEWEANTATENVRGILWDGCETHPSYPLPGPDERTEGLINFLAVCLSSEISHGDIGSLMQASEEAACLLNKWCQGPLI